LTQWLEARSTAELEALDQQDLRRHRRLVHRFDGRTLQRDDGHFLQFTSNDYLGLASQATVAGLDQSQHQAVFGANASPMVTGYSSYHQEFETKLAQYLGFEAALYLNSGFTANEGLLKSVVQPQDLVFADRLNHASLLDGVRFSGARQRRYQHANVLDLRSKLETTPLHSNGRRWIVTDGVFSMDGDTAPVAQIVALAQEFDAALIVDDAHGFGVLGNGRGTCAELGVSPAHVDFLVVTCGKAMGAYGACILGRHNTIELLTQQCRAYVYSTAVPAGLLQICLLGLQRLQQADSQRDQLRILSKRLANALAEFKGQSSRLQEHPEIVSHPIQPLILGKAQQALSLGNWLQQQGILASVIRPPTVPQATSRLRFSLTAAHQSQDIENLIAVLTTAKEQSYF